MVAPGESDATDDEDYETNSIQQANLIQKAPHTQPAARHPHTRECSQKDST